MILDIDAQIALVLTKGKSVLHKSEADDLYKLLTREPLLTFQKTILEVINGKLQSLSAIPLISENLSAAAKLQGEIAGLRSFFDIAAELLAEAKAEEI